MKNLPQTWEEIKQAGYTHRFDLSWKDLFGVTIGTNTAKAFTIVNPVNAGDQLIQAHLHLTTAFKDSADTAFNSITLDFGDTGSATRYFSGVQIDENGTEVIDSYVGQAGSHIYTAADSLIVTVHSMAAKDLTTVNVGKLYLEYTFLQHGRTDNPAKNPLL